MTQLLSSAVGVFAGVAAACVVTVVWLWSEDMRRRVFPAPRRVGDEYPNTVRPRV